MPDWSDHNISDPGITLIETFAMMVDQLIYRLNRVPDRNYIKFLELLGSSCVHPGRRRVATFWLSAPQSRPISVRAETEVSTDRPTSKSRSSSRPPRRSTSFPVHSNRGV